VTFEARKRAEIAGFKTWSNQMTKKLIAQFPVPGTNSINYDSDNEEPPWLHPTKSGDPQRSNKDKPKKLYRADATGGYKWRIRNIGLARGTYVFVVLCDEDDGLTLGKHGHEHLAKDRAVEFAGEATFQAGELLFWTNNSGHYLPHLMLGTTRVGLPWSKFAPMNQRNSWVVVEALKITNNLGVIARLLGWSIADVERACAQEHITRYTKTW
jgi:hypothetical protein